MTLRSLAVCAGLTLVSPPAQAGARGVPQEPLRQSVAQPPPIASSLQALRVLFSRVPTSSPARLFDLPRARAALNSLQQLSNSWPAASPADYRANLARDVNVLQAALNSRNQDRLAATLQAIADDLEIKLEHCTRSGGKLGGSVVVRVRSVRGGDEIKNWQVFYLPRVLEAAGSASPGRFPRLSSPTDDSLVPGRYVMWLQDPTSKNTGERTVVKVGEGKKELLLDLSVPVDSRR
ncbi:MAG: hypothetical protein ABJA98_01345 [Acidobacteriota bacterium]